MSAQVPEIECRLCSTLFPETLRFCPSCREPRPDIHEDLLMAARLTGVSYEILLQRAWMADGLARGPMPARPLASPAPEREPGRLQTAVVERIRRQRDVATIGCVVLLALIVIGTAAAVIVLVVRDGEDSLSAARDNATATAEAESSIPAPPAAAAGGSPVSGNGQTTATPAPEPTVAPRPLVLDAGQQAGFSDGYRARILAYDDQVMSLDPERGPTPGNRFVGVEVEVCGGSEIAGVAPTDWVLEMPDEARYDHIPGVAEGEFPEVALVGQQCASGWLTFEVPTDPPPATSFTATRPTSRSGSTGRDSLRRSMMRPGDCGKARIRWSRL